MQRLVAGKTTIDLNLIAVFVAVVEGGSFTSAARALGLPTSSASRAVARLEDRLGVRLLQRTTRRLVLTEAGRRYFQQVRPAMGTLDEACATVTDMGRAPRGTVRLTAPPDLAEGILTSVLARFAALHPTIQVDVSLTGRRVDLVQEGFDLALRAGSLDDSSLVARKLITTALKLFASPAYLERRGRPRRPADLLRHDCLLYRTPGGILPWRLHGPAGTEQVAVQGCTVVDEMFFVRYLALAGAGIGMMPDLAGAADVLRGTLTPVLPAYTGPRGSLHLVSPPLKNVPTRVALLRSFLLAELPALLRGGAPG